MALWTMQTPASVDKSIRVDGPNHFRMWVDYDDVDHKLVLTTARVMLDMLNAFWTFIKSKRRYVFEVTVHYADESRNTRTVTAPNDLVARAKAIRLDTKGWKSDDPNAPQVAFCTTVLVSELDD